MNLNPKAAEFKPGALVSRLEELSLNKRSPLPVDQTAPPHPPNNDGGELDFDDAFYGIGDSDVHSCNDASSSEATSPRNQSRQSSLVGPSPLPSPSREPQFSTTLSNNNKNNNISCSITNNGITKIPSLLSITEPERLEVAKSQSSPNSSDGLKKKNNTSGLTSSLSPGRPVNSDDDGVSNADVELVISTDSNERQSSPYLDHTASTSAAVEVTTYVETRQSAAVTRAAGGKKRLGPNDFELLRVVGQGAFGKVFQVRKRDTGEVFAMKVMRKDRIMEKDHGDYVKAERDVLTSIVHPYIVTLRYSFQTAHKLYLVLDFINGGHLFFQLYRAGTFEEPLARLYTAEMVLGLTHLHSLGFVHRDLKPENVLLDKEGHIKITDFGLAKVNMSDQEEQRTNSFIGTMEYMAPEIISGRGHGKAVDWWSVGILLYEMLCGVPPFRAKGRQALQKLIVSGKYKLPPYLSSEAASLLKGLLQKEPPKRLGFGPKGSQDVTTHAFFRQVDWKSLKERTVPSPFRPTIKSPDSVENFDKIWTDLPAHESPCTTPQEGSSLEKSHHHFEGFTYEAPSVLAQAASTDSALPLKTIKE